MTSTALRISFEYWSSGWFRKDMVPVTFQPWLELRDRGWYPRGVL